MGDLTYGTGNMITARRLKNIISNMGYTTYLYNVKYINESSPEQQNLILDRLLNLLLNKKIHFIIGIHLWRSGRVLNILKKKNFMLPYCLLVSGTDANIFLEVI
jgi:hypothetical protein